LALKIESLGPRFEGGIWIVNGGDSPHLIMDFGFWTLVVIIFIVKTLVVFIITD